MRRPLIIGLLAALVTALPVAAKRLPTTHESTAIRAAFAAFLHEPGSPAAKDDKLVGLAVSTVDPAYAAGRTTSPTVGAAFIVFHRSGSAWKVKAFGSSLGCSAASPGALTDLGVPCGPDAASTYVSNCGKLVRRPAALVLACADANYSLGALRWSDWGNTVAGAAGHASVNDCNPNCAAGHMHDYTVRVAADKLTKCSGRWIYLRVTVRYLGAPPDGVPALDVHTFTCAQALHR